MLERVNFAPAFAMRPDLRRLDHDAGLLDWSIDSGQACEEKLAHYLAWLAQPECYPATVCAQSNVAELEQVVETLLTALVARKELPWAYEINANGRLGAVAIQHPHWGDLRLTKSSRGGWALKTESEELRRGFAGTLKSLRLWFLLGMSLHEDIVLLRAPLQAQDSLIADCLHVSFPSGWLASDKLGQDFLAIHSAVPDAQLLQRASSAISRAMLASGPYERFVWTISASGARARFGHESSAKFSGSSPLWLRYERQTTLALPEHGRAVFFIHVYLEPLARVFQDLKRRDALLTSLASMSESVIAYKGLGAIRQHLLA